MEVARAQNKTSARTSLWAAGVFHISRSWIKKGKNIPPFPLSDHIGVNSLPSSTQRRRSPISSAIEQTGRVSDTHTPPAHERWPTPDTRPRRWTGRLLQVPGEAGRKRQSVGLVDLLKGCLMPVRDPHHIHPPPVYMNTAMPLHTRTDTHADSRQE